MKWIITLTIALLTQISFASEVIFEGFESFVPNKIGTLNAKYGDWICVENQANISSKNVYKGERTLQLDGGQNCTVKLVLKTPLETDNIVSFAIQRFTSVNPFDFQLFAISKKGKECIFSSKTVPLKYEEVSNILVKEGTTELVFILTSPRGKGCFIDDFKMNPLGPMEVLDVVSVQPKIPLLIGSTKNELLKTIIHTKGALNPDSIVSATYVFEGNKNNLESLGFYHKALGKEHLITTVSAPENSEFKVDLATELKLGDNEFIVRAKLKPSAKITDKMTLACVEIINAKGKIWEPKTNTPLKPMRIGHLLRAANQDKCHTARIPGIVTSNKGTLLAVYDNRYNNSADLQDHVDVGLSRSTNGGQTWEPMKVIMDMKEWGGKPQAENGIGDPAILVDRKNNTIWVAALWAHGTPGKRTWWASGKGTEPNQTGQFVLVKSEDDGVTWSEPINITKQVKKHNWNLFFQGPGMGISMRDGTLVFPAQFRDERGIPHSTIIYSKDHGKTWVAGTGAKSDTTEAQVVELSDGKLMLNMRDNRGGFRSIAVSADLGKTWIEHATSRSALVDPVCMGSIIRAKAKIDGDEEDILIFSNPNTKNGRYNLGLKVSCNDGNSWDVENAMIYDERPSFGYSCLTMVDKNTVGVLYEGERELYFILIKLDELLNKEIKL